MDPDAIDPGIGKFLAALWMREHELGESTSEVRQVFDDIGLGDMRFVVRCARLTGLLIRLRLITYIDVDPMPHVQITDAGHEFLRVCLEAWHLRQR